MTNDIDNSPIAQTHSGEGDNIFGNKNVFQIVAPEEDNESIFCPYCGTKANEEQIEKRGQIKCDNCNRQYFEYIAIKPNVTKFINLPSEKSKDYENLLFQASVYLGEFEYNKALIKTEAAIDLNATTPDAWLYKALSSYFTTPKDELIKTSAKKIIHYLETYEQLYGDNPPPEFEQVKQTIAFRLFKTLNFKISKFSRDFDQKNESKKEIFKIALEYETCYKIFSNPIFIKTMIYTLSGYNQCSFLSIVPNDDSISSPNDREISNSIGDEYLIKENINYSKGILSKLEELKNIIQKFDAKFKLPEIKFETTLSPLPIFIDEFWATLNKQKLIAEKEKQEQILREQRLAEEELLRQQRLEEEKKIENEKKNKKIANIIGVIVLVIMGFVITGNTETLVAILVGLFWFAVFIVIVGLWSAS